LEKGVIRLDRRKKSLVTWKNRPRKGTTSTFTKGELYVHVKKTEKDDLTEPEEKTHKKKGTRGKKIVFGGSTGERDDQDREQREHFRQDLKNSRRSKEREACGKASGGDLASKRESDFLRAPPQDKEAVCDPDCSKKRGKRRKKKVMRATRQNKGNPKTSFPVWGKW